MCVSVPVHASECVHHKLRALALLIAGMLCGRCGGERN